MLCKIGSILKTSNKAYNLIFDSDNEFFKISIRKLCIFASCSERTQTLWEKSSVRYLFDIQECRSLRMNNRVE